MRRLFSLCVYNPSDARNKQSFTFVSKTCVYASHWKRRSFVEDDDADYDEATVRQTHLHDCEDIRYVLACFGYYIRERTDREQADSS